MKLNREKTAMLASYFQGGNLFQYGFYKGGRGFVALNGELLSKMEAIKKTGAPMYYIGYPIRTLVDYLVNKYNK